MSGSSGFGFRPEQRLLNKRHYQAVFDRPDCKVSPSLCKLLVRGNEGTSPRLGLVFARRNVRHAVERNRLKRLVRESFRLHRQHLPNVDVVLIARPGFDKASNAEVFQMLAKAWRQLIRRYSDQSAVVRHENPPAVAGPDVSLRH